MKDGKMYPDKEMGKGMSKGMGSKGSGKDMGMGAGMPGAIKAMKEEMMPCGKKGKK